jgi:hypothetical protein
MVILTEFDLFLTESSPEDEAQTRLQNLLLHVYTIVSFLPLAVGHSYTGRFASGDTGYLVVNKRLL